MSPWSIKKTQAYLLSQALDTDLLEVLIAYFVANAPAS